MGRWNDFISLYTRPATKELYQYALIKFFKSVYGDKAELEPSCDKYFLEKRDYEADIKGFFVSVKDKLAPKTVYIFLAIVKTFLVMNKVQLDASFWKLLNSKIENHAISEETVPSKEQLRQILTHMDSKGRALYLTLISSGMRINEALSLELSDVNFDTTPTRINIRSQSTKGGLKRITFISSEATVALKEWLKIRDEFLKTAVSQSKPNSKSLNDKCVFPFCDIAARNILQNALYKSRLNGVDSTTKRSKIHPHVFRKFFRSQMGSAIQLDVTEAIMGHSGYLTSVYRVYPNPEKTLAEFYLKGESSVTIFGESIPAEVQQEIKGNKETIQQLASMISEMKTRLDKYEQKYGFLDTIGSELKEMIQERRIQKAMEIIEKEAHEKHLMGNSYETYEKKRIKELLENQF